MRTQSKFNWNINHQIRAGELRVIGSDGKQIGILSKQDAIRKASQEGLDLVEIAPSAKPPVAKIVDIGKFTYEQEKKERQEKKKAKASDLKEIRFSPFIAKHDYENRIERILEFLNDNHKIRLVVVFMGRHMGSKQFGYELLKRVVQTLGDKVSVDSEPKFIGRHLFMTVSPLKKPANKKVEDGKENNTRNEEKNDKNENKKIVN